MVKYVTRLTQGRFIVGVLGVVAFAAFSGLYALSKDGTSQISRLAMSWSWDDNANSEKAQACSLAALSEGSSENQNTQQFISCAGFLE